MGNFKIKEFRDAKRIKQADFAPMIGLTQSNLSRYENNGVDLSDEQLDMLRERFGAEEINSYITDSSEQIRDKSIPEYKIDSMTLLDMITIIKKQNETICQQVEVQNQSIRQITNMNERLLNLLEKISLD